LSRKIGLPAGKIVIYRILAAVVVGLIISRLGGVLL